MHELIRGWHEFYLLLGTAATTLVGLTFIAASIGASSVREENRPALGIFLGSTVAHFTAVLVIALLALAPSHSWESFVALFALIGIAGFVYSLRLALRLFR